LSTVTHRGIEVDSCPLCKGLWLDKGEWEKLVEARRSPGVPSAGVPSAGVAAAIGGAAVAGSATALAVETANSSDSFVTRDRESNIVGDVVSDVVDGVGGDLLEGAFSLIGDICSSIFA
jgi:hypothetical protein